MEHVYTSCHDVNSSIRCSKSMKSFTTVALHDASIIRVYARAYIRAARQNLRAPTAYSTNQNAFMLSNNADRAVFEFTRAPRSQFRDVGHRSKVSLLLGWLDLFSSTTPLYREIGPQMEALKAVLADLQSSPVLERFARVWQEMGN